MERYPNIRVKASSIHQHNEDQYQLLENLNEDLGSNLEISPLTAIYIVCDGFGGNQCAEFVAAELPRLIRECPYFESLDVPADEALLLSVLHAVEEVEDLFTKQPNISKDSGCSFVVCIIRGDLLCVAWVGTCQLGIVSDTGDMTIVTKPHRISSNASESHRIRNTTGKAWEGTVSADGKIMGILEQCRAVGCLGFKEKFPGLVPSTPEVSIFRFCPETHGQNPVIVLGSDGLWDYVNHDKIALIASSVEDDDENVVQAAAMRIAKTARKETANSECVLILPRDDLTVVICKPSL